jgi:hypothetical protein
MAGVLNPSKIFIAGLPTGWDDRQFAALLAEQRVPVTRVARIKDHAAIVELSSPCAADIIRACNGMVFCHSNLSFRDWFDQERKPPLAKVARTEPFVLNYTVSPGGRELHVYDFDGTLFRSPVPNPALHDNSTLGRLKNPVFSNGYGWYQDTLTLDPPYVPPSPGPEWFVADVVASMKRSVDAGHYVVVMTGRTINFLDRVKQCIALTGVKPHDVICKPDFRLGTIKFKVAEIRRMVAAVQPSAVALWEDRPEQRDKFVKELQPMFGTALPFAIHMVVPAGETILPEAMEQELVAELVRRSKAPGAR